MHHGTTRLFDAGSHRNVLLPSFDDGDAIPANQHLVVHDGAAMILDPGGHKVYSKVLAETMKQLSGAKLEAIFLSHQDPDIVAAINDWLMTTDATAYAPSLWTRFIAHVGLDRLVSSRLVGIPDAGRRLPIGAGEVIALPAHFLHSCGNLHLYDPVSKILYSGDLGASLGTDYVFVEDFESHVPKMLGFHQRYMASTAALRAWVAMIRTLDVETVAPQHGAIFRGRGLVEQFLSWLEGLEVGIDRMMNVYAVPA